MCQSGTGRVQIFFFFFFFWGGGDYIHIYIYTQITEVGVSTTPV